MDPLAPLSLLISLGGVGMIIFVVWVTNRKAPPLKLGGEAGVRQKLALELPSFQVGKVAVDAADAEAIAVSADGRELVLDFVLGGRPVLWRLALAKLPKVELKPAGDGKASLEIHTGEFTKPVFTFGGLAAQAAAFFPGLANTPASTRGTR